VTNSFSNLKPESLDNSQPLSCDTLQDRFNPYKPGYVSPINGTTDPKCECIFSRYNGSEDLTVSLTLWKERDFSPLFHEYTPEYSRLLRRQEVLLQSEKLHYTPQSEKFDAKAAAKAKFAAKQKSIKIDKLKQARIPIVIPKKNTHRGPPRTAKKYEPQAGLVKSSIDSLKGDIEVKLKRSFSDPEVVSKLLSASACLASTLHLLHGETRPSKIISILNLGLASVCNTTHSRIFLNTINLSIPEITFIKNLLGFNPFSQQTESYKDDDEGIQWLKWLPKIRDNWEAVKASPAFSKISNLISIVATMGFIDSRKLNWNVKGITLFNVGALRKHADATDLISAAIDTITFLFEGAYDLFRNKSPRKFLFDNAEAAEFDNNYILLLEASQHAKTMNLDIIPLFVDGVKTIISDTDYGKKLTETIEMARRCVKISTNSWQKSYYQTRLEKLILFRADFDARRSNGKVRKAPMSVWISGPSGVGKTTLSQIIMTSLLKHAGVPEERLRNVAVINEMDPFDSTITGDTEATLYDDVANTSVEFVKRAPTQRIIDFDNNSPMFANKAELEGKGKTPVKPKVSMYTSNSDIYKVANQFSNEPFSIVRRAKVILKVKIRPEFQFGGGDQRLDTAKVFEKYSRDYGPLVDIWEIQIFTAFEDSATYTIPVNLAGRMDPNFMGFHSITETMEYIYAEHTKHMGQQDRIVSMSDELIESLKFCPRCNRMGPLCHCAAEVIPDIAALQDNSPFTRIYCHEDASIVENLPTDSSAVFSIASHLPSFIIKPFIDDGESYTSYDSDIDSEDQKLIDQLHKLSYTNQAGLPEGANIIPFLYPIDYNADIEYEYPGTAGTFVNKLLTWTPAEDHVDVIKETFEELTSGLQFFPAVIVGYGDYWLRKFAVTPTCRRLYWAINAHRFNQFVRNMFFAFGSSLFAVSLFIYSFFPSVLIFPCISICTLAVVHVFIAFSVQWHTDRLNVIARSYNATTSILKQIKSSHVLKATAMFGTLAIVLKVLKTWKKANILLPHSVGFDNPNPQPDVVYYPQPQNQSGLLPKNRAEIQLRDDKVNPWAIPEVDSLHVDMRNQTMTHDQVVRRITTNLYHGVFVEDDQQQTCDMLMIRGNLALLPLHLFQGHREMKCIFTRHDGMRLNSSARAILSVSYLATIPGVDLALVCVPSLGVHADITHLFPASLNVATSTADFVYRSQEGEVLRDHIRIDREDSESGGVGFKYVLPYATFRGLCMGVLVGRFSTSCIAGVHLRGIDKEKHGLALTVTKSMIDRLISETEKWVGQFPVHSAGTFPTTRYDKPIVTGTDIHVNSPLNYLPLGSTLEVLGSCSGRSSHTKTTVHQTRISPIVTKVTGVPNHWAGPKFNNYRMWQASLAYSANPSVGVEGHLLEKASLDYVTPLLDTFQSDEFSAWSRKELIPLNEMEIICGRDGARFIDAMKKNTSKGFPLTGPKKDWMILLDPDDYPDFNCPVQIRQEVLDVFHDMESTLRDGQRCYAIFKACVKDEPTPTDKDKVRVFQAADWGFQMLVRKYFLPVSRLLSMFPILSECAVGVNAHGPEWDQLAKEMKKFGADRIFAGDYSKYDLRMPAQLIIAAFDVMITIAKECGEYTAEDLVVMRGIATEIAYSCVAYNGDLIIHLGSNPSGQNMTVYINCIVNSLLMRCSFFHLYPADEGPPKPFRHAVAALTYGDDVKGSVRKGFDWFNHISYANFLEARDMKFTMPDKTSTPTPYMMDDAADFLKRKNVWNEDTQHIHGALDEMSIFKSLHSVLQSTMGEDAHVAGNIDTALEEWWHHGRDIYNLRHRQMVEIAQASNLLGACRTLGLTYDDRLAAWKEKYLEE
jgi:hypothetical protein